MRKPAFTFLELLIAISLFAVGMLSLLQVFPINRRFLQQSSMTTQASFLAQEQMESVFSVPYAGFIVNGSGSGIYEARHAIETSGPFSQYERETVVHLIDPNIANSNPAARHNYTSVDKGLKKIDVNVYWMEKNLTRSFTLSTYVSNH